MIEFRGYDAIEWARRFGGTIRRDGVPDEEVGMDEAYAIVQRDPSLLYLQLEESPSGCPLDAKCGRIYPWETYRVIRVNDRAFNAEPRKSHRTIPAALAEISKIAGRPTTPQAMLGVLHGAHYRIVEIPAGEPSDYDGEIYATLRIGRGVE